MWSEVLEDVSQAKQKPICVKWFIDKELKIVRAECGYSHIVVKTLDKDGKDGYYGIAENVDESKHIFGGNFTKVHKEYICKLHVNESLVLDFSVGYNTTYFVLAPENNFQKSIIPQQPDATGMVHFYKERGGEWKFMRQEEYEN